MSRLNNIFKGKKNMPQLQDKPGAEAPLLPGRISSPEQDTDLIGLMNSKYHKFVQPSYREDLIKLLRKLYKLNPDVGIASQDMFKLANTGHTIAFPQNSKEEAIKMKEHLDKVTKNWVNYTFGIDGLVNRFFLQGLVSGAISIEAVPNKDLDGLATIVLVNPEQIYFKRKGNGCYLPYQKNPNYISNKKPEYIKLNTATFSYVGIFNDTDEPYGIPGFMTALDSIQTQHEMRINFKNQMELAGMVGFLEAKMEKPQKKSSESEEAYIRRLESLLRRLKQNLTQGMKDGVVTGFMEDHEFKLNSTTKDLSNMDKPWNMNQQSVANGLGVNGSLIGINASVTEAGGGIMLSKLISQLKNIQMAVAYILEFIYRLELQLAGFDVKGLKVSFNSSTISDELKVQQGLEYKIRNLQALYNQGIINQQQFAWSMGYDKPAEEEPLPDPTLDPGLSDSASKRKRENDKDASDRKTRDKNRPVSKRGDQDTKTR